MNLTKLGSAAALLCTLMAAGCDDQPETESVVASAASIAHASKVKNLLTGLAVTEAELTTLAANDNALRSLIDQWLEAPECRGKLLDFFALAFQQTQLNLSAFDELLSVRTQFLPATVKAQLLRSAERSFPMTALALVEAGRPFTEVLTTERFMLNPPLMSMLAYIDDVTVDDAGNASSWLGDKFGDKFGITLHFDDSVQVPFEESIDPDSPNFLHFYQPCPRQGGAPNCQVISVEQLDRVPQLIWSQIFGLERAPQMVQLRLPPQQGQFTDDDWNDWRMISIRPPEGDEQPSIFWDLPAFRSHAQGDQTLRLSTPRVGFMTTLAFFANWPTNLSNLARVTVNQALIVGLGISLADADAIVPVSETGNPDGEHSQAGTTCFGCHQTLDPVRNFFRQSYTVNYHAQAAQLPAAQQQARFTLGGLDQEGAGVRDFAAIMADAPGFAAAWAQKLCEYANSSACPADSSELARVSATFRDSGYDFKTLVRELLGSALVAQPTAAGNDAPVTIARRDHLCAALQNRLGLDACDLESFTPSARQNQAHGISGAGYTRGATRALLPRDPNLFFSASLEGLCGNLAELAVDPETCPEKPRPCLRHKRLDEALGALVHVLMGLSASDARAPGALSVLHDHYDEVLAAGYAPHDALQSAFVLACTSPTSAAIGF